MSKFQCFPWKVQSSHGAQMHLVFWADDLFPKPFWAFSKSLCLKSSRLDIPCHWILAPCAWQSKFFLFPVCLHCHLQNLPDTCMIRHDLDSVLQWNCSRSLIAVKSSLIAFHHVQLIKQSWNLIWVGRNVVIQVYFLHIWLLLYYPC